MSYDLYFWHHADGHPDDVIDNLEAIEPHPSVLAFRAEVLDPPAGMAYSVGGGPGLIITLDIYGTARALADGL